MTMRTFIAVGFALGIIAAACAPQVERVLNQNHCANRSGDDWCVQRYGEARAYCEWGCGPMPALDGCVEAPPPADECYSPCGGEATALEDASCLGIASTSSSSSDSSDSTATEESGSSGSESGSTTGPMPCASDEECTEEAAPFCGTAGECGTCDGALDPNAACAGVDAMAPLCVGEACVACTPENSLVCDEQLLLCDGSTNSCVPCEAHAECGSGACELAVGRCFPEDFVVEVDGDGGRDYMTVVAAVGAVPAGGFGVIVVHDQESGLGYPGVLIDGGKTIALLAAPGESPILQGTGGNPGLRVEGAGTILYMDGLEVSLAAMNAVGMRVDGALAWVDRSRIVQNSGGGVLAQNGAELVLKNCFVGGSVDDANALEVNGATANVLYSTLGAGTTTAIGLACTTPVSVVVRNSLIVSRGLAVTAGFDVVCDEAEVTFSATESVVAGVGNEAVGEMDNTMPQLWFVGYGTGNFHLQNAGLTVFADIAEWSTGDPPIDIDGDPRPGIDATPDYAGADVPQ